MRHFLVLLGVLTCALVLGLLWVAPASTGESEASPIETAADSIQQSSGLSGDAGVGPTRTSIDEGAQSTSGVEQTAVGSIRGRVYGPDGVVESITSVVVFDTQSRSQFRTNVEKGAFSVEVPSGLYLVGLAPGDIPIPLVPSAELRRHTIESGAIYAVRASVLPLPESTEAVIALRHGALIEGRVIDARGAPVPQAFVRIQSMAKGAAGLFEDCYTDELGVYRFTDVRPGGSYVVQVWPQTSSLESARDLTRPSPTEVASEAGGFTSVPDIVLGAGPVSISGLVVDQFGKPFEGLPVKVYSSRAHSDTGVPFGLGAVLSSSVTDASGAYSFSGLPAESLAIQVAGDFVPSVPLGERLTAFWTDPIEVDARNSAGHLDAGTAVAERSQPFFVTIQMRERGGGDRIRREVVVRASLLDPETSWDSLEKRRPPFVGGEWTMEPGSSLSWSCETPHPPVVFEAFVSGVLVGSVTVFPAPGESTEDDLWVKAK